MLTGFQVFVLAGGNPANFLADPRLERVSPWRLEVAAALNKLPGPSPRPGECLHRWALVESLNRGSLQRIPCPVEMRGTGRWFAGDGGGHYRLLRDMVLTWVRLPEERRELFEEVALLDQYQFTKQDLENALPKARRRLKEELCEKLDQAIKAGEDTEELHSRIDRLHELLGDDDE